MRSRTPISSTTPTHSKDEAQRLPGQARLLSAVALLLLTCSSAGQTRADSDKPGGGVRPTPDAGSKAYQGRGLTDRQPRGPLLQPTSGATANTSADHLTQLHFESGVLTEAGATTAGDAFSWVAANCHTGVGCARYHPKSNSTHGGHIAVPISPVQDTVKLRVWIRFDDIAECVDAFVGCPFLYIFDSPHSRGPFLAVWDDGYLSLRTAGSVGICGEDAGLSSYPIKRGEYYQFAIASSQSTKAVTARIYDAGGRQVGRDMTCTATDLGSGGFDSVYIGNYIPFADVVGADYYVDDLDAHAASDPGNVRWMPLPPASTAVGSCAHWSTNGTGDLAASVTEVSSDPAKTFAVYSAGSNDPCMFQHRGAASTVPVITEPIHGVQLYWNAWAQQGHDAALRPQIGAGVGAPVSVTGFPAHDFWWFLPTPPQRASPWTVAVLNASTFGVSSQKPAQTFIYVSSVRLVVGFEQATATIAPTPTPTPTPSITPAPGLSFTPSLTPTPTPSLLRIFAALGQSNMVGYARLPPTPEATDVRIELFGNDYQWHVAPVEPFDAYGVCNGGERDRQLCGADRHCPGATASVGTDGVARRCKVTQVDLVSIDTSGGALYSPLQSFAMRYVMLRGERVGIIPCARTATGSWQWLPPSPPAARDARDTLYGSCLNRIRVALRRPGAVMGGILVFQGESDANVPQFISGWPSRFNTMINGFRIDLGLPNLTVVYAEIGNFNGYPNGGRDAMWAVQRSAQTDTTRMIVTRDVGQSPEEPERHFGPNALRTIGVRFADAWATAQPVPTPTPRTSGQ